MIRKRAARRQRETLAFEAEVFRRTIEKVSLAMVDRESYDELAAEYENVHTRLTHTTEQLRVLREELHAMHIAYEGASDDLSFFKMLADVNEKTLEECAKEMSLLREAYEQATDTANQATKLRATIDLTPAIEQSAVSRVYELADENEDLLNLASCLKTDVAELLPFAIHAAKHIKDGELVAPRVGKPEAMLLLRRFEAGQFGEVAK